MRNYGSGFQTLRRDPELSGKQLLMSPTVEKYTERISIRAKITRALCTKILMKGSFIIFPFRLFSSKIPCVLSLHLT